MKTTLLNTLSISLSGAIEFYFNTSVSINGKNKSRKS